MKQIVSLLLLILFVTGATGCAAHSDESGSLFPSHQPYGQGIGAMPGRVVWSHQPDAVTWDGSGYWWETEHFDEACVLSMVNRSVVTLADQSDAKHGWDVLFRAHNEMRGKSGGYQVGEK